MAPPKKSTKVPKTMQDKFNRIVELTDDFSHQHLNDEYAQLIRWATAALCRKRPSPLASGRDKTWACGITHAIGMVNFLFDSSQDPHISASELYQQFGVSASTGQAKSKQVRDALKMHQMDPEWCLPSLIDQNPMAWLISVNGFMLDARTLPRNVQEAAYAKGLIPYLPNQGDAGVEDAQGSPPVASGSPDALYGLDAFIIDGPVTEAFMAKNPEVSRVIEIQGRNTLADLHQILFEAFEREEEHLYEFQVGGRGPHDPNARRYGCQQMDADLTGEAAKTAIADLGLSVGESFGYWFDFGDSWWHQIDVTSIAEKAPKKRYPRITKRVGKSPPQYADFD